MVKLRGFLDFDRLHFEGRATSFWLPLLKMAFPELNHLTLDDILSCLVHRAIANMEDFGCAEDGHVIGGKDHVELFDAVEFACGVGNLTRGLISEGFKCCALDLIHSDDHNCLCSHGLRLWIQALSSCNPRALHWWGTKCSSFVSICVSVSKRSPENLYYGDTSRDFVVEGNSLLMITAVLMCLSCALGHMPLHPIMCSVISFFSCESTVTYLGAFGASSVKPVQLMSTLSLDAVVREKPRNMPESLATRGPNDRTLGKKTNWLKVKCTQSCLDEQLQLLLRQSVMSCDIIDLKVSFVKVSMSHVVCFKVSLFSSDVSSATWSHKSQAHGTTNDIIYNSLDFYLATLATQTCVTT